MNRKMDEIMEIMHQIGTYLSDYATAEMNGKKITKKQIENNKILETLFIRAQKAYRELQKLILEETKINDTPNGIEEDIDEKNVIEILDIQNPESLINETMNDLDEYLEMAYSEIRYISVTNGEGEEISPSIYKNTKFEALRNSEYNLQCSNLEYLAIRNNIKNPVGAFSFKEKTYILSHMAECQFYDDYAFKQIDKYISDLSQKSTHLDRKTYEKVRDKLIEQKYILYFSYLNNKYNGILQEKDNGKLAIVRNYIDEGLETMLLGMTKFEIEENIKTNLMEMKEEFREVIKFILEEEKISSKVGKKKSDNSRKIVDKDIKNATKQGDKDGIETENKSDNER